MKRAGHARAIAHLLVVEVEMERSRGTRRLRRSQLRWVVERPELARELGVLEQIGSARNGRLAKLGADDGLAALCVPWEEVVGEAVALLDQPRPRDCPRCGARLSHRRPICGRCRSPAPRRW